MFQNITRDLFDNQSDEKVEENKKVNAKDVLNKLFAKQNIILYVVTFLISMVGFDESTLMFNISPFIIVISAGIAGLLRNILLPKAAKCACTTQCADDKDTGKEQSNDA